MGGPQKGFGYPFRSAHEVGFRAFLLGKALAT